MLKRIELDAIDREILRRMQEDARAPTDGIADALGVSAATVQRRLKQLRDTGVIQREIAQIDPRTLGVAMTFVVSIEIERDQLDILDTFRRQAHADPNVQQCYYVTGEADFILVILARDMDEFEQVSNRLLQNNPYVRRFRTSVTMGRPKVGLSVPID
ncbi:MAG: Lrp/AsnC family transcriptional regulator [Pseudomonadota bacterium]